MPYPTPKVEIAFDDGPYVASPTWTDVTSYVRGLSVDRGRSDDWSPFNSSASVTLSNLDRRFDPFNTAGPYFGKLLPRRQIRITANANPGRTNLITNPSFETNTTGWSAGAGVTLARSTAEAYSGSASGLITLTNTVANSGINNLSNRSAATAGLTYTASTYAKLASGTAFTYSIVIFFYNAGGSILSTAASAATTLGSSWERKTITATAPANTATVGIQIRRNTALTGTASFYVDAIMVEQASTAGDYFDGSFPGYAWNGTANASTSSSVYQPVFRGFIDGFPPAWTDAGYDSTVTLSCFDAIGLLSSESLPADWSRNYILSLNPRHYWACDEPIPPYTAGSVLTDNGTAPQNLTTTATAVSGSQLAVGLVNSSLQGVGAVSAQTATGAIAGSSPFTVSMWAILDPDSNNVYGETADCFWAVTFDAVTSKYIIIVQSFSTATEYRYTTTDKYDGSQPRMITFTFQAGATFALYLDGVPVTVAAATAALIYVRTGEVTVIEGAQVQQLIIWHNLQTGTAIQNIYKYSTVAFKETTSARFNRIIGETSFPASRTSVPASPVSEVLALTDDAPSVSSELQKVADSEYAPLFVTRDGILTMYSQNQIRTQTRSTVVQMTVGVGGIPLGTEVALSYDGDSIRNVANITMSQGGVWVDKNTTSISTYGAAEQSVDTQVSSLTYAQNIADIITTYGGLVFANAEPFEAVTTSGTQWGVILDRELNDRIDLQVQPPTGNGIGIEMLLSRITYRAVPGQWQVFYEGSARWASA